MVVHRRTSGDNGPHGDHEEPDEGIARRFAMPYPRRLLLPAVLGLLIAACGAPAASPTPTPTATTPGASADPSPSPIETDGNGVEIPTGAEEVVLRYEEGGGFVPVEFSLTNAPIFTLYGDGTVIFRDPNAQPPPDEAGQLVMQPFQMTRLGPEQVQELVAFAINEGGLGAARNRYDYTGIADAPTATFTINAGGQSKTVDVYALGMEGPGTPDEVIRRQFNRLAERLRQFDPPGDAAQYEPDAWRATLIEAQGVAAPARPWPWPDIEPSDFKPPPDQPDSNFPSRILTADDIAALEIGDAAGGAQGIYLNGPDGSTYHLVLRPLLPDEEA